MRSEGESKKGVVQKEEKKKEYRKQTQAQNKIKTQKNYVAIELKEAEREGVKRGISVVDNQTQKHFGSLQKPKRPKGDRSNPCNVRSPIPRSKGSSYDSYLALWVLTPSAAGALDIPST